MRAERCPFPYACHAHYAANPSFTPNAMLCTPLAGGLNTTYATEQRPAVRVATQVVELGGRYFSSKQMHARQAHDVLAP